MEHSEKCNDQKVVTESIFIAKIAIPNGVEKIGEEAFEHCKKLKRTLF